MTRGSATVMLVLLYLLALAVTYSLGVFNVHYDVSSTGAPGRRHTDTTDVPAVDMSCSSGAVQLPAGSATASSCRAACGKGAQLRTVDRSHQQYRHGVPLPAGVWCIRQPADDVRCNPHTSYAEHTAEMGVMCRSRVPELFNAAGDRVVACSDATYPNTGGQLIDRLTGRVTHPYGGTVVDNADERLFDGSYRFHCRHGADEFDNTYLDHPANRFHPLRDHCRSGTVNAHESVRTVVNATDGTWHCECGDPAVTRVKHIVKGDKHSACSSCVFSVDIDKFGKHNLQAPYACFTAATTLRRVAHMQPCLADTQWEAKSHRCETLSLPMHVGHTVMPSVGRQDITSKGRLL